MSNPYTLADPLYIDIDPISIKLRDADRAEVAALGRTPLQAVSDGYNNSDVLWTILYDGEPCGMVGAGVLDDDTAIVWMLGTDDLTANPKAFLKTCRDRLGELFIRPVLMNAVHKENEVHVRYLAWLGAEFHQTVEINGQPFITFTIREPNV